MAIVARCGRCKKKIRLDDAFADGVWRCPECRALNQAPRGRQAGAGSRPDAPPQRAAPGAEPKRTGRPRALLAVAIVLAALAAAGLALAAWLLAR